MASFTFESTVYNKNVHYTWGVSTTFNTTRTDWLASAFVESGETYEYDGHIYKAGEIYMVGRAAVVPPSPEVTNATNTMLWESEPGTYDSWCYPPFGRTITWYPRFGYQTAGSGIGVCLYSPSAVDYYFESMEDFEEALENNEIVPLDTAVFFDVYIDGTDKPSIFVNWTAGEALPVAGLSPRVCYGVAHTYQTAPEYVTDSTTGLVDVNAGAWFSDVAGSFSYAGSYETTYLSIQQHFEQYLNPASKIGEWGFDGDPDYIKLYLRMVNIAPASGNDGYGDLATVTITKGGSGSYILVDGSSLAPGFTTQVRIHYGEPDYVPPQDPDNYPGGTNYDGDGPGQYDPDDKPDPTDFTEPGGFDGNAVLTKTYAVSDADLVNIGQKLWSQDYFNVLKIQNNPIENIIAVKHFPFAMPSGTTEEIKIGDVSFGVNGDKVASVQSYRTKATLKIGSYTFTPKYKNYLDLAPYTSIKLFLPYVGFIQLDPAEVYGSKITVFYYVDLVTGQCMVRLVLDEQTVEGQTYSIPYMTVYGQMGVDIPLTSSDRVQTELRTASAALTAVGGSVGQMVSGNVPGGIISGVSDALSIAGADYTSQRTSSQSPSCSSFDCQDIFVMIARPAAEYVDKDAKTGYGHLHGYPCHKYKRLSDSVFKDGHFVQIERRTDLKIAATSEENRMLEELLTSGVYI